MLHARLYSECTCNGSDDGTQNLEHLLDRWPIPLHTLNAFKGCVFSSSLNRFLIRVLHLWCKGTTIFWILQIFRQLFSLKNLNVLLFRGRDNINPISGIKFRPRKTLPWIRDIKIRPLKNNPSDFSHKIPTPENRLWNLRHEIPTPEKHLSNLRQGIPPTRNLH